MGWLAVVTVDMLGWLIFTPVTDEMAGWLVNGGPWPTIPGTEEEEGRQQESEQIALLKQHSIVNFTLIFVFFNFTNLKIPIL